LSLFLFLRYRAIRFVASILYCFLAIVVVDNNYLVLFPAITELYLQLYNLVQLLVGSLLESIYIIAIYLYIVVALGTEITVPVLEPFYYRKDRLQY
jgi:hypothetical protein